VRANPTAATMGCGSSTQPAPAPPAAEAQPQLASNVDAAMPDQQPQRLAEQESAPPALVPPHVQAPTTEHSEEAARAMGTNKGGAVDADEFTVHEGTKQEQERYDRNEDGLLDADELALRSKVKDKAASDMLEIDSNNDGVVDKAEFIASGGVQADFEKFDANGDGALDAAELEEKAVDEYADMYAFGTDDFVEVNSKEPSVGRNDFDAVDTNNDGVISKDEFEQARVDLPISKHEFDFEMFDDNKDGEISRNEWQNDAKWSESGSDKAGSSSVEFENDADLDKLLGDLADRDSGLLEDMLAADNSQFATFEAPNECSNQLDVYATFGSEASESDEGCPSPRSAGEGGAGAGVHADAHNELDVYATFGSEASESDSELMSVPGADAAETNREVTASPYDALGSGLRQFDAVDVNNDGMISQEEYERAHGTNGIDFDKLDVNKDGGISKDEYATFEIEDGERSPGGTLQFATCTLFDSDDEALLLPGYGDTDSQEEGRSNFDDY